MTTTSKGTDVKTSTVVQRSEAPHGAAPGRGTLQEAGESGEQDASTSRVRARGSIFDAYKAPADIAADGTRGSGERLPHLDTIQRSFGRHDVSHVRSHVGGKAATSAASLGAHAFAVGDAVGFASAPDLHTAAHEAV
jgi:hypothetical protein